MAPSLDCLIVGAGPAGLTAALYLRRFHRSVSVLDSGQPRAARIPLSNNVPGFPDGIGGPALLARLHEQLARVEGEVLQQEVNAIAPDPAGGFAVRSAQGQSWHARTVLMATGARDREATLPGLALVRQSGLLRECPICDGHEFSGQRIGVIGLSDHSIREGLFLRHFSERIDLFSVTPQEAPSQDLQTAMRARGVGWHAAGIAQLSPHLNGLTVELRDGARIACDVLYSALGCAPGSALAKALGAACDDSGKLIIGHHCETNVPGLFAAGDVTVGLNQIAVALGHGAIAATAIHNGL